MIKNRISSLILLFILCSNGFSCKSYRNGMFVSGGRDEMIQNAIIDFVHTEQSVLHKSEMFHVFTEGKSQDSVYVYIIGDDDNLVPLIVDVIDKSAIKVESKESSTGERIITLDSLSNKTILIVEFLKNGDKQSIWFDKDAVTLSYRAFPDHFYEWDNKVFFWFNEVPDSGLENKDAVIEAMYRHHYVDTMVWCYWPEVWVNDAYDGKRYLFNDKNLTRFSKETIHGIR